MFTLRLKKAQKPCLRRLLGPKDLKIGVLRGPEGLRVRGREGLGVWLVEAVSVEASLNPKP